VDCYVIYWFNSSQLIRVNKFLIIKDTDCKIVLSDKTLYEQSLSVVPIKLV